MVDLEDFKRGIFLLNTRRFGTVAELMIKALLRYEKSYTLEYDLIDSQNNKIEVKFSRVLETNKEKITENNVINEIFNSISIERKIVRSNNLVKFDCNIQQVKPNEFDILYYGLFFYDKIYIYKILSNEIKDIFGYSNKQHRGNIGEGQFHINEKTIDFHNKYFYQEITYEDLYRLLDNITKYE